MTLHLRRWLALYGMLCAARDAAAVLGAAGFEKKVNLMLKEEPINPKCFTENKNDFTCFWQEDEERAGTLDQYSFTYSYKDESNNSCPLRTLPAVGGKRMFFCHLNKLQLFIDLDIRVHRQGMLIYNRILLVELLFLLDPPFNVTVSSTGEKGQLNVTWVFPPLKYMDDSLIFQISYVAKGHTSQVQIDRPRVSEIILTDLKPGRKYKVRIRVRLDGISYNGYWSAWSDPVFVETPPAELDLLIVSLTVIISFMLIAMSLIMLLSQRRFVIKKIWPVIPTPDSKFQGLFTAYGGDFKEWLEQIDGGIWLTPEYFYSEECPSPLEVLSELNPCPSLPLPPLPPKAFRAPAAGRKEDQGATSGLDESEPSERGALTERWRATPHDHWLMDRLRALHQDQNSSLLESHDSYVTLSGNNHGEDGHPDDALEEASQLEVLFASSNTASCESHSDLGSEFPNHNAWMPQGPGYTYMAVADSGVSMDYSPMSRGDDIGNKVIYANEYKNEIPGLRGPFLPRQQPVGLHMD